jgi:hypothetical protein
MQRTWMRNPLRTCVLVMALIPAVARAQGGSGLESVVKRLADSARARGLPSDPLFAKAAEGALKGADSTRIVDAVRRLLGELDVARNTLGSTAASAELVAAASALHAGLTPAQLAHVAQIGGERGGSGAARSDRLVMPLVVLADLVARRVSADIAVSSLETLIARGAPDADFANLRTAIERDIASGTSPNAAMRTQSAAVLRTLDGRGGARPPEE